MSGLPEKTMPRQENRFLSLVDGAPGHHARVEFDLPKGGFISRHIVLQYTQECLRLLRAKIDSLKVLDLHLGLALLQQSPKNQKEVPNVHPNLHAVRVVLPVLIGIREFDLRLRRISHRNASVAGFGTRKKDWTGRTSAASLEPLV